MILDDVPVINVGKHIDGLVQDYSKSSVLAMELLQSCTKTTISGEQIISIIVIHTDGMFGRWEIFHKELMSTSFKLCKPSLM